MSEDTELLRQILGRLDRISVLLETRTPAAPSTPALFFEADLARHLRTSLSTIKRRLAHAPHLLPPQAPSIDRRPRWDRGVVENWIAQTKGRSSSFGRWR